VPVIAVTLILAAAVACQTTPRDGEGRSSAMANRDGRDEEPTPDVVSLWVGMGEDTDGNGLVDSIPVTVYLFADPQRHPIPLHAEGTLVFRLSDNEGTQVRQWVIDDTIFHAAAGTIRGLPGYQLTLDLLATGGDDLGTDAVALVAQFTPRGRTEPKRSRPVLVRLRRL